ncbi:MAG: hypothetical protein HQL78_09260 [Magnetococcales bacterium]|nr:hypothetical protein [Magnetococcales bacterium]MBF0420339.1 hypothetical protein [Magnetococcales bacterium]
MNNTNNSPCCQNLPHDVVLGYLDRLRRIECDEERYQSILNDLNNIIHHYLGRDTH